MAITTNHFYNTVQLIYDTFKENPNVNTVYFGKADERDLYSKNVYPLVHVIPMDAPTDQTSQSIRFTFEIAVLDQRNINKSAEDDKWDRNDDFKDNLNSTYVIMNEFLTKLRRTTNEHGIDLDVTTNLTPIMLNFGNLLDGWYLSATFVMTNSQAIC
jgi:hypothetical protein